MIIPASLTTMTPMNFRAICPLYSSCRNGRLPSEDPAAHGGTLSSEIQGPPCLALGCGLYQSNTTRDARPSPSGGIGGSLTQQGQYPSRTETAANVPTVELDRHLMELKEVLDLLKV